MKAHDPQHNDVCTRHIAALSACHRVTPHHSCWCGRTTATAGQDATSQAKLIWSILPPFPPGSILPPCADRRQEDERKRNIYVQYSTSLRNCDQFNIQHTVGSSRRPGCNHYTQRPHHVVSDGTTLVWSRQSIQSNTSAEGRRVWRRRLVEEKRRGSVMQQSHPSQQSASVQ